MMNRDCQELPIFPYDGKLGQRLGEEKNGQIVESTPSRPRRYYLARIADAGSVPCSATIYQKPKPYRLGVFCPFPQCWRGFQTWPREHHTSKPCVFIPTDASLLSVFSVGHASVLEQLLDQSKGYARRQGLIFVRDLMLCVSIDALDEMAITNRSLKLTGIVANLAY